MSEKIAEYAKDFISSKSVRRKLRYIVLYIGNHCEEGNVNGIFPPKSASKTELDLLVGSGILEQPTNKTFKLTKERGKEVYELSFKEEHDESFPLIREGGEID